MKITITIDVPDTLQQAPLVEIVLPKKEEDYLQKPPYKGILIVKAHRAQDKNKPDARVYQFRYCPDEYPEINGLSRGVPLVCGYSAVRVNPNKFHPNSKGLLPFRIHEHDEYCGAGGTLYPVVFEVFDFEWEMKE